MEVQTPANRARSLDALRGIAILAMIFSGTIPFDNSLPAWMYHAQEPPPNFHFNPNLAGITWVDLVFPCFLFALGAAVPLALSRRLQRNQNLLKVIWQICQRFCLLVSFAIITQHFRPLVINPEPGPYTWRLALIGYILLFLMYVKLPKYCPKQLQYAVSILGWSAGIFFLSRLKYLQDSKYPGFSLYRSDIILLVLANIAFFTSLIWLFTRQKPLVRISILVPLFPLIISFNNNGWNTEFLRDLPLPWLFNFDYLKYLFISLPATVIGDWFLEWFQNSSENPKTSWSKPRLWILIIILYCLVIALVAGLYSRHFTEMLTIVGLLGILGYFFVKRPSSSTEILINRLYAWAFYFLGIGLAFEPYQGGIKKDSATFSYFFVTFTIAVFLLISFMIIIDLLKLDSYLSILINNGQNSMLAYVSFGNLIWPIIALNSWE